MKKVIAVTGTGGVGKTSSVRLSYELLLKTYPNAKVLNRWAGRSRKDISVIVTIDRVKIGFHSLGDPSSGLPDELNNLVSCGCQIIVCARRTRGATFDAVESLRPTFHVVQISKEPAKSSALQSVENDKTARRIIVEIMAVVK